MVKNIGHDEVDLGLNLGLNLKTYTTTKSQRHTSI